MILKPFKTPYFLSVISMGFIFLLTLSAPTPADASTREVRVSLKKYCSSIKWSSPGFVDS